VWEGTLRTKTLLNAHHALGLSACTVVVIVGAKVDDRARCLIHVVVLAGIHQRPEGK
jgi:hypothetical protein